MKLNELTTPFKKVQVITYASNGNTVIQPQRSIRHVSQNIYMDKNYQIYVFYQEYNIGLSVVNASEDSSIEQVVQYVEHSQLATAEQFLYRINILIQKEQFIKNSEIEFLKQIAPNKVPECLKVKAIFLKRQEQEEQKRVQEEREKELAYVQQQNQEAQQTIQNAIQTLKSGGILNNYEITLYEDYYNSNTYHVISHLARLYNITIPIKTQGWINSSLAQVEIPKYGEVTNYKVFRGSNSSKVIFKYLNQLVEAVRLQ